MRTKITLLVSSLLIVIISALAIDSYNQVKSLAVSRANARLESIAQQFAGSSSETTRRRLEVLSTLANSAPVIRFMTAPTPAHRSAAEGELRRLLADSSTMSVRLRDAANRVVLEVGRSNLIDSQMASVASQPGSLTTISPPFVRADTIIFLSAAAIREDGRTLGRLNHWRRVILSPALRTQMSQLIGSNAEMYFGGGDIWLDLSGRIVAPLDTGQLGTAFIRVRDDGTEQLAVVAPILGSPWKLAVEFPMSTVMAQPRAFLRRLLLALVILVLVAMALTWWMSGRVTEPLRRLTGAAEQLAAGVYNVRVDELVDLRKQDEIARLARAFWVMGLRVQDTHAQLQGELTERTDEMRATYKTLQKSLDELAQKDQGV